MLPTPSSRVAQRGTEWALPQLLAQVTTATRVRSLAWNIQHPHASCVAKKKKKNLQHTPDLLDAYSHSVHRNFFIPKLSIYTSLPHLQDWACGHRAHFTDWETDAKEPAIREEFLEQSSQASPPQGGGALLISISLPTEPALPFR